MTASALARRTLRAIGVRCVSKRMHGQRIYVPISFGRLSGLLFDRDYMRMYGEGTVIDLVLSKLSREDVVFDVGAFCGLHSVLFSRAVRTVLAIEPNPRMFATLGETVAANRAHNIIPVRAAVGAAPATADLWGTGSAASLRPLMDGLERQTVTVHTLDSLAAAHGLWPDVLKVDVEGAEHDVLAGGSQCLSHCRLLALEAHLDHLPRFGATFEAIDARLNAAGLNEVFRSRPERDGRQDSTRLHLIYERRAVAVQ